MAIAISWIVAVRACGSVTLWEHGVAQRRPRTPPHRGVTRAISHGPLSTAHRRDGHPLLFPHRRLRHQLSDPDADARSIRSAVCRRRRRDGRRACRPCAPRVHRRAARHVGRTARSLPVVGRRIWFGQRAVAQLDRSPQVDTVAIGTVAVGARAGHAILHPRYRDAATVGVDDRNAHGATGLARQKQRQLGAMAPRLRRPHCDGSRQSAHIASARESPRQGLQPDRQRRRSARSSGDWIVQCMIDVDQSV